MSPTTGLTLQAWRQYHQQHAEAVGETLENLLASLSTTDPAWIYLITPRQ